jgi:hypothetical protein
VVFAPGHRGGGHHSSRLAQFDYPKVGEAQKAQLTAARAALEAE